MRTRLSFLAFLFFLGGCSYFNDPGSELVLNVDNEFEIDIRESLLSDGRELQFYMTAINDVMCEESELILDASKSVNLINIVISEIAMTNGCDVGTSFPSGEVSFNLRNSRYDLMIQVKDHTSQSGFLDVNDTEYTINLDDTKGLILERNNLKRIPEKFMWGHYPSDNAGQSDRVASFLAENDLVFRPLTHLAEGYYSYFSIDRNGNIKFDDLPYSGASKKIAFDNIDLESAKTLITNFKQENPDLKLTMYFSDGTIL